MRTKLRSGYTTGACAAAAAKAAIQALVTGQKSPAQEIWLPAGRYAAIPISEVLVEEDYAMAGVVKDAGDDPDVTDGALIQAKASLSGSRLCIHGGEGVGRVTKKGLQVPPGHAAINPVPMEMILREVRSVLPTERGADIEIIVPRGRELARRTLNSKLGIEGGISIIGTTGIVEPMSIDAFKRSLEPQVDLALAAGNKEVILVPGRTSMHELKAKGVPDEAIIVCSNFIGHMLKSCARKGVSKVLLYGRPGKMLKLALGAFDTHSKHGVNGIEALKEAAYTHNAPPDLLNKIEGCTTAEEAGLFLMDEGYSHLMSHCADEGMRRSSLLVEDKMVIGLVIASQGRILGQSSNYRSFKWAGSL